MARRLKDARRPSAPPDAPVAVLKFGGSVLTGPADFRSAAGAIRSRVSAGHRVLAVVSALRGATDELWASARALDGGARPAALAALLGTGEDASVQLLEIALAARGVAVRAVPHAELPLVATGPPLDARPVDVDVGQLRLWLRRHAVVVVPGFVGRERSGGPCLLGRGGSDYTALFLAERLRASECRLVKDVDGLHPRDPATAGDRAGHPPGNARYTRASWEDVRRLGAGLVQDKALDFARCHGLRFRVGAAGTPGTQVGPDSEVAGGGARRTG